MPNDLVFRSDGNGKLPHTNKLEKQHGINKCNDSSDLKLIITCVALIV